MYCRKPPEYVLYKSLRTFEEPVANSATEGIYCSTEQFRKTKPWDDYRVKLRRMKRFIAKQEIVTLDPEAEPEAEPECRICFLPYTAPKVANPGAIWYMQPGVVITLNCGDVFCGHCAWEWFAATKSKKCPTCRVVIKSNGDFEKDEELNMYPLGNNGFVWQTRELYLRPLATKHLPAIPHQDEKKQKEAEAKSRNSQCSLKTLSTGMLERRRIPLEYDNWVELIAVVLVLLQMHQTNRLQSVRQERKTLGVALVRGLRANLWPIQVPGFCRNRVLMKVWAVASDGKCVRDIYAMNQVQYIHMVIVCILRLVPLLKTTKLGPIVIERIAS